MTLSSFRQSFLLQNSSLRWKSISIQFLNFDRPHGNRGTPPSRSLRKSISGVGGRRGPEKKGGPEKGASAGRKGPRRAGVVLEGGKKGARALPFWAAICGNFNFRQFPEISAISGNCANFRQFPEISASFRKFPAISSNFRKFSPILPRNAVRGNSGNFRKFPENLPEISGNFRKLLAPPPPSRQQLPAISGNLPEISGNFRKFPEIAETVSSNPGLEIPRLGSLHSGGQKFLDKIGQQFEFLDFTSLGCWSLE